MHERFLRFPATLAAYAHALSDLQATLDQHGIGARGRYNVELVFEEIVGNIIRHGCAAGGGRCSIEVSIGFDGRAVVVSFQDNGPPFDPRKHEMPEVPQSLDNARVGGLGLLLVHKASERIDYERTPQQKNHLTVAIAAG